MVNLVPVWLVYFVFMLLIAQSANLVGAAILNFIKRRREAAHAKHDYSLLQDEHDGHSHHGDTPGHDHHDHGHGHDHDHGHGDGHGDGHGHGGHEFYFSAGASTNARSTRWCSIDY